jgi:ABC-type branched-subunit amino acid transport system substrate-binding protein
VAEMQENLHGTAQPTTARARSTSRRSAALLMRRGAPLLVALVAVAGTSLGFQPAATASTRSSSAPPTNGEWPGVGKICEPGPGGASNVRGVGPKSIHIAVFNDASNTVQPGLEVEFVQQAKAFAAWCNASGGINGRQIVIDDRDGALFNAAQVTSESCQSDFMAVGGGMALDEPSVPIREHCGLGEISGYTVSLASESASDQVNPNNINTGIVNGGWFGELAKKYPQAVKKAAMGAQNDASVIQSERKFEYAAEAHGWHVVDFQVPPIEVTDWSPFIQDLQSKGVEAVWPSADANITPYLQAMATAGYKPAFLNLGTQFYNQATAKAVATVPHPPIYVETGWWPLEMASQNPSTEQLLKVMHTYAKGDTIDFDDEEGAESWLLWAKSATACGANLTVSCVLNHAASEKNWSAGGLQAPVAQLTASNANPTPSPCFAMLQVEPNKFVYDKALTQPTQSIWNCNPKNNVHLTQKQVASLSG